MLSTLHMLLITKRIELGSKIGIMKIFPKICGKITNEMMIKQNKKKQNHARSINRTRMVKSIKMALNAFKQWCVSYNYVSAISHGMYQLNGCACWTCTLWKATNLYYQFALMWFIWSVWLTHRFNHENLFSMQRQFIANSTQSDYCTVYCVHTHTSPVYGLLQWMAFGWKSSPNYCVF